MIKKLVAALLSLSATASAQAAPAGDPGYKLKQSSDYLGSMTVLASKKAIRVEADKYGIVLTMVTPTYQVVGWNDHNKTFYSVDYKTWRARFLHYNGEAKVPKVPAGKQDFLGYPAERYLANAFHTHATDDCPAVNGKHYNTEVVMCQAIRVPAQFVILISTLAGVGDDLKGFPLRINRYTRMGSKTIIWDTHSISKTNFTSTFAVPKNYRRVDTELALFVGATEETPLSQKGRSSPMEAEMGSYLDVWGATDSKSDGRRGGKGVGESQRSGSWAPGF